MYYVAKIENKRMWDKVEDVQQIIQDLREHREEIVGIELSSNSLGFEVAQALAGEIKNLKNLKRVNYRDIFVSRKKEDLPKSLKELVLAILDKEITYLDLSDNAFGPIGVEAFDFFLQKNTTLKELHVENNGLGPEGAERLAQSLLANESIKLDVLAINRNRLENKGAENFAHVLTKMQSLHHVEFFQNGIKEEGMAKLFKAFMYNKNLEVIKLNDNFIKNSADILLDAISALTSLRVLDVSDSLLGNSNSVKLFHKLAELNDLREIYCNYNEVEKKSSQMEIFQICLKMKTLEIVELKGNEIDPSIWKKFKNDLAEKIKKFEPYSDEEEIDLEVEEDLAEEIEKLKLDK